MARSSRIAVEPVRILAVAICFHLSSVMRSTVANALGAEYDYIFET
jgi:hypothetical protein